MAWSRAFQKCIINHFLDNFFCKHFYYLTGLCNKKLNFCEIANYFADSKSRAQELSNNVSFVIFGHQTWDLEGGSVSWFSSAPSGIGLRHEICPEMGYEFFLQDNFLGKSSGDAKTLLNFLYLNI